MKDRFSNHAKQYAAFRPKYPDALYNTLFKQVSSFGVAWDAGTGNGQAAIVLAKHFERVHATDISAKQLENAENAENIVYAVGETCGLPDHAVDLITVAQAIHWFDRGKFYMECARVGKPGAVVAVWGYGLLTVEDSIDEAIRDFYVSVVGPFWDPERKHIDQHYRTIGFPFAEITTPSFIMPFHWTLAELEGYLTTWSAVQKFMQAQGVNPVPELISKIRPRWKEKMNIKFPLFMKLGKI